MDNIGISVESLEGRHVIVEDPYGDTALCVISMASYGKGIQLSLADSEGLVYRFWGPNTERGIGRYMLEGEDFYDNLLKYVCDSIQRGFFSFQGMKEFTESLGRDYEYRILNRSDDEV